MLTAHPVPRGATVLATPAITPPILPNGGEITIKLNALMLWLNERMDVFQEWADYLIAQGTFEHRQVKLPIATSIYHTLFQPVLNV